MRLEPPTPRELVDCYPDRKLTVISDSIGVHQEIFKKKVPRHSREDENLAPEGSDVGSLLSPKTPRY
jgi:hypothetical protein